MIAEAFVLVIADRMYGPFSSANKAVKYFDGHWSASVDGTYSVRRLIAPDTSWSNTRLEGSDR